MAFTHYWKDYSSYVKIMKQNLKEIYLPDVIEDKM